MVDIPEPALWSFAVAGVNIGLEFRLPDDLEAPSGGHQW